MHHRPSPIPKIGSGKSGKVGREFRGPCPRQLNSYVGVNGITSGVAMQYVGDYGFRHVQTMRRAIRWEVTEYPMLVDQHLLP